MKRWLSGALLLVVLSCSGGRENEFDAGINFQDAGPADAGAVCRPRCTSVQTCVDGTCVTNACENGETRCGAVCVDTQTDRQHCGSCSKSCPGSTSGGVFCESGQCGVTCGGEFCPLTSQCVSNHCCALGSDWCTDHCADIESDLQNCGGCGEVCSAQSHGTASCVHGSCQLSCTSPYVACGTGCVNYSTDPANCGSCGHDCGPGATCSGGHCGIASHTCTIQATSGWQTCSGLSVVTNDQLDMTASGTWKVSSNATATGPGGSVTNPDSQSTLDYRLENGMNYSALLYRVVGSQAFPFTSGSETGFAYADGALQFRINEGDIFLGDNTGSLNVSVRVTRFGN